MSFEFDLLRISVSFLCGLLISQSGTLVQSVTQNPLASPTTFGFPSLIVLLILVVNSLGLAWPLEYSSLTLGFVLFLCALIVLFVIKKNKKHKQILYSNKTRSSIEKTLLLGLGINLLVGAVFAIWHFIFMAMNKTFPTQIWFGNFRFVDSQILLVLLICTGIGFFFLSRILKKIQILSLGISFFSSLDIDLKKTQNQILALAFLQTLVVVCLFGVFSFAALVFPLILKRFEFFRRSIAKELIIGSILSGVVFMLLDLACYNIPILGAEIPVGMLSATLGSFVMVMLLVCQKS